MSATVVDEEVNRVLVALSCSDGAVRLVFITARVHTAGIFIEAAEKRKSECLRIELMLSKSIIFSTGVMVLVIIITIMMNVTESKALHFIYVCPIVYCGNNQLQSSVLYFQVFLLNFANTCTMQSQMLTCVRKYALILQDLMWSEHQYNNQHYEFLPSYSPKSLPP